MPLPQKIAEQLGREPPKTPGWSGKILMFSGTIFFIVLAVYLGLAFGYAPSLTRQIEKLKTEIDRFGAEISTADQLKLVRFYSQLGNIKSLLASQRVGLRAFDWIEKNTQVNSYLAGLTANLDGAQLSYQVSAATMNDALQQMAWFQKQKELTKVGIGGISLSEDRWQFSAQLTLENGYFSKSHTVGKNATGTPR